MWPTHHFLESDFLCRGLPADRPQEAVHAGEQLGVFFAAWRHRLHGDVHEPVLGILGHLFHL